MIYSSCEIGRLLLLGSAALTDPIPHWGPLIEILGNAAIVAIAAIAGLALFRGAGVVRCWTRELARRWIRHREPAALSADEPSPISAAARSIEAAYGDLADRLSPHMGTESKQTFAVYGAALAELRLRSEAAARFSSAPSRG